MKRVLTLIVVALSLAAMNAPVWAWEFQMKGEYENRFRYFGRTGDKDLFGQASLQEGPAGTFVGFSGPNIYGTGNVAAVIADSSGSVGNPSAMTITRGGFSRWGSDAFYNDSRLTLRPVIRVNPAIRVMGVYTVGGMRNKYRQAGADHMGNGIGAAPLERYYMSQTSMNAFDGTLASWEQFRATITLPWAIWSIGLKDFPLGLGTALSENTRAESFLWVVPYGPFRWMGALWLARGRYLESWNTVPDGETKNEWFGGILFTYDQGPFSAGGGAIYRMDHRGTGLVPSGYMNAGPVSPAIPANPLNSLAIYGNSTAVYNPGAATQQARDDATRLQLLFFKYNNGRFFANAEYFWVNVDRTIPTPSPYAPGTGPGITEFPLYVEAYHFFSEIGAYCGPAKMALMYCIASGPVLDHSQVNGTPASNLSANRTKRYFGCPINYQVMEPYEFLMFNTYAGGNDGGWAPTDITLTQDEHGQVSDAFCFGGRLDYAVASNLNLFGSYIWAHRLERAGFFAGGKSDTGNGVPAGAPPGSTFMRQFGGTTPYVPDGFIGWEVNAGGDWKLLENLTFRTRYSYWQPGEWFDFAYQNIGYVNGAPSNSAVVKGKSAINAFQASVLIQF